MVSIQPFQDAIMAREFPGFFGRMQLRISRDKLMPFMLNRWNALIAYIFLGNTYPEKTLPSLAQWVKDNFGAVLFSRIGERCPGFSDQARGYIESSSLITVEGRWLCIDQLALLCGSMNRYDFLYGLFFENTMYAWLMQRIRERTDGVL